jgi:hypothetical protein
MPFKILGDSRMTSRHALAAFALALLGAGPVCVLTALPADAGFLRRKPEGDVAVAVSRFGNGTVSGPVRTTSTGYEVDLTENDGSLQGYGTASNECGIFGCLDLRYPR